MLAWLPTGVELLDDVSGADWIVKRLRPWDPNGARLESFIPEGFEAYARIFHSAAFRSARRGAIDPDTAIRWSDLARERGMELTPDIAFLEVSGIDPGDQRALAEIAPMDGKLPPETCDALAALPTLKTFLTRPFPSNRPPLEDAHPTISGTMTRARRTRFTVEASDSQTGRSSQRAPGSVNVPGAHGAGPGRPFRGRRPARKDACERSRTHIWRVQAISSRRPSSAASRATRSRLRSAHRPETRSSRRLRTARCSTSGPTLAHTDTPRRT